MFERVMVTFAAIVSLALTPSADILSPYDYPVISEVQWIDNLNWSIELDNAMWSSVKKSCTTGVVKLYIASSKKTYSTRIYFNDAGLGVVTRTSIIPANPGVQQVMIMKNDTIFIPDPEASSSTNGWKCPIVNPKSGYSLIGIRGGIFIESARPSIGTRGNYTTIHRLHVVDRDLMPIANAAAYSREVQNDGCSYPIYVSFRPLGATNAGGVLSITATIGAGVDVYLSDGALERVSYSTCCSMMISGVNLDPPYQEWQCSYIDDAVECDDTVMLRPNYQKVKVLDNTEYTVTAVAPRMNGMNLGKSIGPGEFLFRFFPRSGGYPIVFYRDIDSSVAATCSCSYVDTRDTICTTVIAASTAAAERAWARESFHSGHFPDVLKQTVYDIRGRSIRELKASRQMIVAVGKAAGNAVNTRRIVNIGR